MTPPASARGFRVRGARLWDAVVVVALIAVFTMLWAFDPPLFTPASAMLAFTAIFALLWRRSAPLVALTVTALTGVASAVLAAGGVLSLPIAIAIAGVVASGRRRLGAAAAVVLTGILVAILVVRGFDWNSGAVVGAVLAVALGVAIGLVQDARRRIVQDAVDRAERAEALRDAEARRAVAEERLRIARELHDVLAHQIAVVGVQTGLAEYVLEDDPDAARTALETARSASSTALAELATLLQLLRRTDDDRSPETAPSPSLRRLSALIDDVRQTGLIVDVEGDEPIPEIPPVVDLAAYRVLQEGLTNAHKYGDGRASVSVRQEGDDLALTVRNREASMGSGATGTPSTGLGLIGMRERVESVGGTLDVRNADGEFTITVILPTRRVVDRPENTGGAK